MPSLWFVAPMMSSLMRQVSPEISVIMPCYNRSFDLLRVLQAYDNQGVRLPFEIIAVDDGSTDTTLDVLKAYQPQTYRLKIDHFETNQGPAAARNRGIALAAAPIILFVGDDIYPGVNFIRGHIGAHERLPGKKIAILGRTAWAHDVPQNSLMIHIDTVGAQQFSYYYLEDGREYDYRHLYTSNISIKSALLKTLDHWFDIDFGYAAFEDVELAFRLAKLGLRIVYDASIFAEHYHYHTIWSFSLRQLRSGMMAWVLMRKHPLVAGKILRVQFLRFLPALLWAQVAPPSLKPGSGDRGQQLENLALHLASFYEWSTNSLLDQYYLRLLQYFYHKGLISGLFKSGEHVNKAQTIYTEMVLLPLLIWFRAQALDMAVELPLDLDLLLKKLPCSQAA